MSITSSNNPNNLNMGMKCVKYMLFVINIMFALTAGLLVTIGTTIQTIFGSFDYFLDDHFLSPPNLMIAIGIIMLIVALFGCFGAIKESTALINIYGVLLGIICILEVAAAISAFVLQTQVDQMLIRTMDKSLKRYENETYVASAVDFMQNSLQCCGIDSQENWDNLLTNGIPQQKNDGSLFFVPYSCCAEFDKSEKCISIYEPGCYNRLHFVIAQSAMLISTGATAVAFVQFLGVICAFMLAKTIRRTKSLRAARRYQLQQSLIGNRTEKINHNNKTYSQLENKEKNIEPIIYIPPSSPSVA